MAASTTWGLPERRANGGAVPKSFNIAAKVQRSAVEQNLTCRVHPVAVLKILDAYVRRKQGDSRVIGTLVGWISEGSIVDVTDSFPVVHKDQDDNVLMDQNYHKDMLQLRQKWSPRETVVGWFSTGNEIQTSSAIVHNFYCTKESQFTATAVLPGPVHLLVDTSMQRECLGVKAFVNVRTVVADNLLQFHELPLKINTSAAERSGIRQLMHARRAARDAESTAADLNSMDGFEGGLKELLALFRRVREYVQAVRSKKIEGDVDVGRGLTAALCAEPIIDASAVEQLCHNSLQDALMVVYLSNVAKTQIAIAEKVNAAFRSAEMPP